MKIGFYGNSNNYSFMLARAFRRRGHEVVFLVVSRERLGRPEFRYGDITVPYPFWIHDLSHSQRWRNLLPGRGRTRALQLLNSCDAIILNEEGPALGPHLRRPYFCLLTGSDLEVFADPAMAARLKPAIGPAWMRRLCARAFPSWVVRQLLIDPQRKGLQRAIGVNYFPKGSFPVADRLLAGLGIADSRRTAFLMTDLDLIRYAPPPRNRIVRIFCATRLNWLHEPGSPLVDLDYKGSDIMIHGLALFWKKSGLRLDINLVQKGLHVAETKRLVDEVGLSSQVSWHDEMSQQAALEQTGRADIIIEQLAESAIGMAGLDAMAMGRPVIINTQTALTKTFVGETSPLCQARTPAEVCLQLERLTRSPEERERVGAAGRRFVEDNFSVERAADICLERLQASA